MIILSGTTAVIFLIAALAICTIDLIGKTRRTWRERSQLRAGARVTDPRVRGEQR